MHLLPYRLGERDAAALDDDVDVVIGPAEKAVPDITADDKGPYAQLGSRFRHHPEHGMIQISFRSCHTISLHFGARGRKSNCSPCRSKKKVFGPFVMTI